MNVNEYISSGILEGYVLGTLSDQEKKEVECMSHIYPEIKEEVMRLQNVMEAVALKIARTPDPSVKNKILQKIQQMPREKSENKSDTKIISSSRFVYYLSGAAAAVIAVLVYFWWQDVATKNKEIASLKTETEKWQDDYLKLDATLIALNNLNDHMVNELNMFRNPEFKTVFLMQVHPKAKGNMAIVCWNSKNKSIMIAGDKMPDCPENKSFQLWAIVDGKPMDMGVLPDGMTGNFITLPVTVDNPQTFAITLENKGGSPVPTIEEMYLAGNL